MSACGQPLLRQKGFDGFPGVQMLKHGHIHPRRLFSPKTHNDRLFFLPCRKIETIFAGSASLRGAVVRYVPRGILELAHANRQVRDT